MLEHHFPAVVLLIKKKMISTHVCCSFPTRSTIGVNFSRVALELKIHFNRETRINTLNLQLSRVLLALLV